MTRLLWFSISFEYGPKYPMEWLLPLPLNTLHSLIYIKSQGCSVIAGAHIGRGSACPYIKKRPFYDYHLPLSRPQSRSSTLMMLRTSSTISSLFISSTEAYRSLFDTLWVINTSFALLSSSVCFWIMEFILTS